MSPEFLARVNRIWATHFTLPENLPAGTTLRLDEESNAITFWPVGAHVVVEIAPAYYAQVEAILKNFPPHHRLTCQDLPWQGYDAAKLYLVEPDSFSPALPPAPYTVRQLTPDDQTAFDLFLAQCSESECAEGDVSIDHLSAFGVLEGTRIVAAASTFEWCGFLDLGVLTDPQYRGKGLGKAAVDACARHHLSGEFIMIYRHSTKNLGSQGIAQGLHFAYYGLIEDIYPLE